MKMKIRPGDKIKLKKTVHSQGCILYGSHIIIVDEDSLFLVKQVNNFGVIIDLGFYDEMDIEQVYTKEEFPEYFI
jgi:hypothetical protein